MLSKVLMGHCSELRTQSKFLNRRDAREAEGARLEIVYSANNGIEGSNPSLSARRRQGFVWQARKYLRNFTYNE
jgi:hypothetical protein